MLNATHQQQHQHITSLTNITVTTPDSSHQQHFSRRPNASVISAFIAGLHY
jgi:hypothetical protein